MKKLAVLLILFGIGLAVFGLTGFRGELSANLSAQARFNSDDGPYEYSGYFQWPINERLETTFGMISLISGVLLRKNST